MKLSFIFILIFCFLFSSCKCNKEARTICLNQQQQEFYELLYKKDSIIINLRYPAEDGHTIDAIPIGKCYLRDGEYYGCDDNNLFMSVKKDTFFVINSDTNVPHIMNVYIGLAKNIPSYINIPKSEKIDGRYITKFYTDEKDMKYVGYEYYYDKDYTIISIRHVIYGVFK